MTIREHEGITAGPQAWVPTKKKTADLAISGLGGIQRFRWGGTLWGNVSKDRPYMVLQLGPDKGASVAGM
jgi:hypothetical protein